MLKRKWLALTLAAALTVTSLTGCGAEPSENSQANSGSTEISVSESGVPTFTENGKTFYAEGVKITDEPITLKGFGSKYPGNAEWDENMLLWKELEKRTGVKIEWETVENSEARSKALALFAAEDLPDLLGKNAINASDVTKFAQSGQLVNFKPYMDAGLMPNFKKLYDSDVNVRIACTAADGGVYALPCYYNSPNEVVRRFMFINEKWLENVGMEKPKTLDELLEVLRAFRDQDANGNGDPNDEYPMSLGDAIGQTERTIRALAGIDNVFGQPYNVEGDQIKQMYTSENMKKAFELLHTLYSEGLVEPDLFTRKATEFFARLDSDKYGVTLLTPPSDSSQFGILEPSFGIDGADSVIWNWKVSPVLTPATFSICSSNEYPQVTARYMDYFYSEEGATLVRMGVEGDTYQVNADGSYSYTDKIKNDPEGIEFAMAKYSFWLGDNTVPGLYTAKMTDPLLEGSIELEAPPVFEKYLTKHDYSMPALESSLDKERTTLQAELNKYYDEARAAFMTGQMDIDTQWDEYVKTCEQLQVGRLEEIYQQAYDIVKGYM